MSLKTVRSSKVVEKSIAPETYLVLRDPAKFRTLQVAVKTQRVIKVAQETVAAKTDQGGISFIPGTRSNGRLLLIANAKSRSSFVKTAKHGGIGDRQPFVHPLG